MNRIRFVHTDHLRLGGSIAGLAAAPDWLRRLARDATRGAVSRIFEIATNQNVDFVFIGGSYSDSQDFQSSVLQWLEEPIHALRQHGVQIVMAASQSTDINDLADLLIGPDERLHVKRRTNRVHLSSHSADSPATSDLAISLDRIGPSSHAACEYLYQPQVRYHINHSHHHSPVYSAGAPQSQGPDESGPFGCLIVDADPATGHIEATLEATDPLRFESRRIVAKSATTSQNICDTVVDESRALARQQRHTTIVDWRIKCPAECAGAVDSWQQNSILASVRSALQEGHLGTWPRRILVSPTSVRLTSPTRSEATCELETLLFDQRTNSTVDSNAVFAELVTGMRLLGVA